MKPSRRSLVWLAAGALVALAAFVAPASGVSRAFFEPRERPWYRLTVSPDGTRAAIHECWRGLPGEVRIVDLASGDEIEGGGNGAWEPRPQRWCRIRIVVEPDGTSVDVVEWTQRRLERRFPVDRAHATHVSDTPGVVFVHVRDRNGYRLERHDFDAAEPTTILSGARACVVILSPDDERALVYENGYPSRYARPALLDARLVDSRDGSVLRTIEAPWMLNWVGTGHRYLRTEDEGRMLLVDLERETRVRFAVENGAYSPVQVLDDGQALVLDGQTLKRFDGTSGALLRTY